MQIFTWSLCFQLSTAFLPFSLPDSSFLETFCFKFFRYSRVKVFKISHLWPVGASSGMLLSCFDILVNNILAVCYDKIFQDKFLFSLPQTWNQTFLQGSLVPFSWKWYLEKKSWCKDIHCYWKKCCVGSFQWAKLGNIYFFKIKLGVHNDISSSISGQQGSYLIDLILHLYFFSKWRIPSLNVIGIIKLEYHIIAHFFFPIVHWSMTEYQYQHYY